MGIMVHQPTFGWIVAKKLHSPIVEKQPVIHGIISLNAPPPPHHYAEVIAVGPGPHIWHGVTLDRPPCAVGDVIMVNAAAGTSEAIEGVEYFWFVADEVKATVPKPAYPEFMS